MGIGLQTETDYDVAVCSIQTLQRRPQVLDGIDFSLAIIDETHRAMADGYLEVLTRLGVFDTSKSIKLVGLTATDYRGDEKPLSYIYEDIAYKKNLLEFIQLGWLVPIVAKTVHLKGINDETNIEETISVEEEEEIHEEVYKLLRDESHVHTTDAKSSIIMCGSVPEGIKLESYLKAQGVEAVMIHSDMDKDRRKASLAAFRSGKLKVLLGYNILIEGFDAPRAEVLIWLRRTNNPLIFVQGIGRITRPLIKDFAKFNTASVEERHEMLENSEKPEALFFDFSNTLAKHDIIRLGDLFDLHTQFDFERQRIDEVVEEIENVKERFGIIDTDSITSISQLHTVVEEASLWKDAISPDKDIPENAQLSGYFKQGDKWQMFFSQDDIQWSVEIAKNSLGDFEGKIGQVPLWKEYYYDPKTKTHKQKWYKGDGPPDLTKKVKIYQKGKPPKTISKYEQVSGSPYKKIGTAETKEDIFYEVENHIWKEFPKDIWRFNHKEASWRKKNISPKLQQKLQRLRNKGLPTPVDINNGAAANIFGLSLFGALKAPKLAGSGKKRRKSKKNVLNK